jgi:hypothetical protein
MIASARLGIYLGAITSRANHLLGVRDEPTAASCVVAEVHGVHTKDIVESYLRAKL